MPARSSVTGSAKMVGGILFVRRGKDTTIYRIKPLYAHPSIGESAWTLTKMDGTSYEVLMAPHGAECSCPDWLFCRDGVDRRGCKHCCALRAVGLLRG